MPTFRMMADKYRLPEWDVFDCRARFEVMRGQLRLPLPCAVLRGVPLPLRGVLHMCRTLAYLLFRCPKPTPAAS